MKVLIYGGRNFLPNNESFAFFHDMLIFHDLIGTPLTAVISGKAKGADAYGEVLAKFWNLALIEFPADWETHGRKAGALRNIQMLEEGKPDLALEFPGGRGTAHMRSLLDKAGIKVWEYVP